MVVGVDKVDSEVSQGVDSGTDTVDSVEDVDGVHGGYDGAGGDELEGGV